MSCKIVFRYLASCTSTCKNLARFLLSCKKLARDLFFARNLHDSCKSCIFFSTREVLRINIFEVFVSNPFGCFGQFVCFLLLTFLFVFVGSFLASHTACDCISKKTMSCIERTKTMYGNTSLSTMVNDKHMTNNTSHVELSLRICKDL